MTDEKHADPVAGTSTPGRGTDNHTRNNTFSPVSVAMEGTTGTIFLGTIAVILTVALVATVRRNRDLLDRLVRAQEEA